MPQMEMYGMPAAEIRNLRSRWRKKISGDCTWKSFNAFAAWCGRNGYRKGLHLVKRYFDLPHGPGNSYFGKSEDADTGEEENISSFCNGCIRVCPGSGAGCTEWREWFVKNWNQNIHIPIKGEEKKIRQAFQYEHPDLEREGLRFENRQRETG